MVIFLGIISAIKSIIKKRCLRESINSCGDLLKEERRRRKHFATSFLDHLVELNILNKKMPLEFNGGAYLKNQMAINNIVKNFASGNL